MAAQDAFAFNFEPLRGWVVRGRSNPNPWQRLITGVATTHLPFPGIGKVETQDAGWRWHPVAGG